MTIKQQTQQALANLGAFTTPPQTLQVHDGPRTLSIDLVSLETLGCAFTRFELASPAFATKTTDELSRIATALSSRLNYLLEPISPIEIDHERCLVQMRSTPPQQGDDGASYYELLVSRAGLSLIRYQKTAPQARTPIPALVTREVLLRLADDFSALA